MPKAMTSVVCTAAVILSLSAPEAWARPGAGVPRVRPHDARTQQLLSEAQGRSSTIRALLAELERSDLIVYVAVRPLLDKNLAGRLTWITATEHARYVHIEVSPHVSPTTRIAALGHELRHAVEVASAPSIVDVRSLERFYLEHGVRKASHTSGWETEAALRVGEIVLRELRGPYGRAVV